MHFAWREKIEAGDEIVESLMVESLFDEVFSCLVEQAVEFALAVLKVSEY